VSYTGNLDFLQKHNGKSLKALKQEINKQRFFFSSFFFWQYWGIVLARQMLYNSNHATSLRFNFLNIKLP
jgi:hypothetical protein